nr:DUF1214 domain-containing protein [uncultured Sphingomonas sp.]
MTSMVLGLLLVVGGTSAACSTPLLSTQEDAAVENARTLGRRAFIWGYPLVRAAQLRQNLTLPDEPLKARPPSSPGAPINRFGHAQELGSPRMRQGVAPNSDTLYSLAWLDLNDGPFVLETPDFGDRYYTFQMGQADSSTQQALGSRTHGSRLPPIFIQRAGERHPVPRGMVDVRSSQRYLMIAARVLVRGAEDMAAVGRLQQQFRLRRWEDHRRGRDVLPPISPQRRVSTAAVVGDPKAFLVALGEVLRDWRPGPNDAAMIRSLRRIGLSPERGYVETLAEEQVLAGVREGEAAVRQRTFSLGRNVNGWSINNNGSNFGGDDLLRAAVAMDQIYVLPAEEALYPNARLDSEGRVLDGRHRYELRFTRAQLPPVRFFWSATMYHAQGLMVENAIGRYAIGDRTPGLIREPDGGIRILLQNDAPTGPMVANWLPAPAGEFMLMLRLYGPLPEARTGAWTPPAIVRIAPDRQP